MKRTALSGAIPFFVVLTVFLFSASLPGGSWAASGKTRVAVVDFEQKATQEFQGKQVGEIVAEWLITALVRTGRFDVVERAQLQKILKEQQLGISGMINQETAAKVGELLGVKVIITGSVIQMGNTYDVNARLISVEDGSILKAERIRGPSLEVIEGMMASLADSLKSDFPIEGFVVMVSGKRAMIDLGRIHGVEAGMRFAAFRKGAPIRHPITGKMLKGEDIKIGELVITKIEAETSWGEVVQEEPGVQVVPGNVTKQAGEGPGPMTALPTPTPTPTLTPTQPAAQPMSMGTAWSGKVSYEKIVIGTMYDLLLGDGEGTVTLYLNQGTKDSPKYAPGMKLRAGGKEIRVRNPSAPCVLDWDGDGKRDLLVGDGGGYLHLFLNQGSNQDPNFAPGVMVQAAGKNLDVGRGNASPCVVDWNEDGRKDLLMGKGNGELVLYLNEGSNENPIFGKPISINNGKLDVGSDSSPDVADLNGDGKKDLIVGNDKGEVYFFYNIGTNQDPRYDNEGEKLPLQFGSVASPRVINVGGMNHLVVADIYGEVTFCQNSGTRTLPKFTQKKILRAGKR